MPHEHIASRIVHVLAAPRCIGLDRLGTFGTARPKKSLDFHRDLLSCLRPVSGNNALQRAPDEA